MNGCTVKFASNRKTSTKKKETDTVFRLRKNGKRLETIDYANNLKSYLNTTRRLKSISFAELNTVLMGLQAGASNTDGETTHY